jgi:mannose-6-phosphate isomerase-like protein (cupin superfamily)
MKRIHIDELEPISLPHVTFLSVRRRLGLSAFGANAYSAENAGEPVIEDHDEARTRHEELYVVLTGRATFTVGGEEFDAPPGTLVRVEPEERRAATASEPGTVVLAISGTEGAAGPVSPFEHWYAAYPAYSTGDYARAYEIASGGLADHPDHGTLHYQLACYAALGGELDTARRHLDIAFAQDPRARQWAAEDSDLDALRPL